MRKIQRPSHRRKAQVVHIKKGTDVVLKILNAQGIQLAIGAFFYVLAIVFAMYLELGPGLILFLHTLIFAVLMIPVLVSIVKHAMKRKFIDENFLVFLATIGAFSIEMRWQSVSILLFFQVGRFIENVVLKRTKKSIAAHMDIRPEYAYLKKGNQIIKVEPKVLKPKQTIVIKPGEKIPVDAVVTRGTSMVDTKALTGESEPKEVKVGHDILSGCLNLSGAIEARVSKHYEESTGTKILGMVERASEEKAERERFAEAFMRLYTPVVIVLCILVMLLPPMIFPDQRGDVWLLRGLTFLVAACPCGLVISIPLAYLGGIRKAVRKGILIKSAIYLEKLTKVETFLFDKTGTLTEGVFHVKAVCPYQISARELIGLAAYAEAYSTHPIAASIRKAYGKYIDTSKIEGIREDSGFGVHGFIDGQEVYVGNDRYLNENGFYHHPVIEVGTAVHVTINGYYVGYILLGDGIRPDANKLVRWLKRRDYDVIMISGDNELIVNDVAQKLDIESAYANLMPQDKLDHLTSFIEIQREGDQVAAIGDGINDAPVLAKADVGIAMGGLGADVAIEAADVILLEDEPGKIIDAILIAGRTRHIVLTNMVFAILMKVLLLGLAVSGMITMERAILVDLGVLLILILNSHWVQRW
ncbi:MAG: cadmium-translocating P-type ATPase [Lachnospiraceae bacterium]|nr:cadmium-translocating P-type ATPase [Lachnospiraceae bacterium]